MPLNHILSRRIAFSCGRQLSVPAWSTEANAQAFGKLARSHGHDYILDVFYEGTPGADGMIVNLADVKPLLAQAVAPLEGAFLRADGAGPLGAQQPTLPNLVDFLWHQLPTLLGAGHLARVKLQETARDWATRTPHAMTQTRAYEFAAAHRLHAPTLSDEENEALYGRCNNLAGHGHNFGLEVTVEGEPDPQTGLLLVASQLDAIVDREIFERFDHRHLNEDCPELAQLIPTTENFARVIFEILEPQVNNDRVKLRRIGLRETQKNYFEVEAAPSVMGQ